MKNNITKFQKQFGSFREKAGLTFRALESVTGIKWSALAAMNTGHRPVGEGSARRIAAAFRLSGEAHEAFVLAALATSKERVLESVKDYPPEVLNLLGRMLLANGIKPRQIIACDLDAIPSNGLQNTLRFALRGGRNAFLHVSLTLET